MENTPSQIHQTIIKNPQKCIFAKQTIKLLHERKHTKKTQFRVSSFIHNMWNMEYALQSIIFILVFMANKITRYFETRFGMQYFKVTQ